MGYFGFKESNWCDDFHRLHVCINNVQWYSSNFFLYLHVHVGAIYIASKSVVNIDLKSVYANIIIYYKYLL